jgi:hypothetical protein
MKKITQLVFLISISIFFLASCDKPISKLNTGIWRGALITETGAEIPFDFEVIDSAGKNSIAIINSSERFNISEITINGDSIHIQMPIFDSEIKGTLVDGKINGVWIKHLEDKFLENGQVLL